MIVRPAEPGCVLITQPDHAQLARRIMEHCVSLVENPVRPPFESDAELQAALGRSATAILRGEAS